MKLYDHSNSAWSHKFLAGGSDEQERNESGCGVRGNHSGHNLFPETYPNRMATHLSVREHIPHSCGNWMRCLLESVL